MAGTLTATTIQNDTSNPPTFRNNTREIGTICRAWVNFDGTGTVTIRASFNVSSITDNGTGQYTVNFTNAFADANYAGVAMIRADSDYAPAVGQPHNFSTQTASQLWLKTGSFNALQDSSVVTVAVFR
jgi:hypothetical protein